jgi:hypothetical protein
MSDTVKLHTLPDGRIVAIGQDRNADSALVNALRLFSSDGSEITSDSVLFGAGTPVGAPDSDYDEFAVLPGASGGFRILAKTGSSDDYQLFELDASGAVTATSSIDTSAGGVAVPYIAVDPAAYLSLSTGQIASSFGQNLFISAAGGTFESNTERDGPFEAARDIALLEAGDRILRVTDVNASAGGVEIRAQFYALAGAADGPEILVADGLDRVSGHWDVEARELEDGRIAIAYAGARDGDADASESAVFLTILNADGTVAVPEQMVNTGDVAGAQDWINLWPLLGGGLAVSTGEGFLMRVAA